MSKPIHSILKIKNVLKLPRMVKQLISMGVEEIVFSAYTGSFYSRDESLFPSLAEVETLVEQLEAFCLAHPDMRLEFDQLHQIIKNLRSNRSPEISSCRSMK
jgi:hypothetical protein